MKSSGRYIVIRILSICKADDVLTVAVRIAEIITVAGYINVDFADVETVMKDSGVAIMGIGAR